MYIYIYASFIYSIGIRGLLTILVIVIICNTCHTNNLLCSYKFICNLSILCISGIIK